MTQHPASTRVKTLPFSERVPMVKRRVFDNEKQVHFVTFSCYKRRTFLQQDRAKRIVIGQLGSRLANCDGLCTGFVIIPDHVHALVWFSRDRPTQSIHEQVEGPIVTRDQETVSFEVPEVLEADRRDRPDLATPVLRFQHLV